MTNAVRGRLLSPLFASTVLPDMEDTVPAGTAEMRALERIGEIADEVVGPASGPRRIADTVAIPLARALRLRIVRRLDRTDGVELVLGGDGPALVPLVVRPWEDELDTVWRRTVLEGIASEARWCLATNGRVLRVVDAHRTWSRRHLEFDLAALAHDEEVRRLAWTVGNAAALTGVPALLDRAVRLSAEHGIDVCRALGAGVVQALAALFEALQSRARRPIAAPQLLEECLTVIYRILFLLFAEGRGLVPVWHPVYRERYTIGSLVSVLMAGRTSRGIWPAVQAISRMVHAGCTAGSLTVTAFNGRLFSPAHTHGIDGRPIDDRTMGDVVLRLGSRQAPGHGRVRTRYEELDVEQLGSVYEHVLEYQPDGPRGPRLVHTRDARKASGTFYTPREIAAWVVERTLGPLVHGRTAAQILEIRVLDPAMGSGAFLVAACRYLARRLEDALMAEGTWHRDDTTESDRAVLRREVVQRCLYGVDLNPVAAQLARLSLWLVALARDKPLSFLDHRLVVGNSLVGAAAADIHRFPSHRPPRRGTSSLPLFDSDDLSHRLAAARDVREAIAAEADDSAGTVRSKEQRLARLSRADAPLASWKRALDLWCARWFWPQGAPPARGLMSELTAAVLQGSSTLPGRLVQELTAASDACAEAERFLHWDLTFPEVFHRTDGGAPGFDAVICNPPWDMVRGDSGDDTTRAERRRAAHRLTRFARDSGVYTGAGAAHVNRYALFVERALHLVRRSGRLGLVLPSGVLSDAGAAELRSHLFSATAIDEVVGMENRAAIFPIHRSVKFVLLSATAGGCTDAVRCRFGVSRLDDLERRDARRDALVLTRALIERVSGGKDLGIPELQTATDLRIIEAVTAALPALGDERGWCVHFGRELNATDDRNLLTPRTLHSGGRPVVEGKVLTPFQVALDKCELELDAGKTPARALARHARLAYREVAAATNRLTLIAAIVPARAVTTHTVFCLKTTLMIDAQWVLCGLLNSFVANYLIRMRVGTHVTAGLMSRLRVPVVSRDTPAFDRLRVLARTLSEARIPVEQHAAYIELQALAARLYGLTASEFAHVLDTFPLIPEPVRHACLASFAAARDTGR